MGRETRIPLPHRQALNRTLVYTKNAPRAAGHPPHVYVRAIRVAAGMRQDQLARRAGIAKSHVALIESGRANVGVETLRKVFDALFCDLLLIPKARKRPTEALAERRLARKEEPRYWERKRVWD